MDDIRVNMSFNISLGVIAITCASMEKLVFSRWEVLNMLICERDFELIDPHLNENRRISILKSRGV